MSRMLRHACAHADPVRIVRVSRRHVKDVDVGGRAHSLAPALALTSALTSALTPALTLALTLALTPLHAHAARALACNIVVREVVGLPLRRDHERAAPVAHGGLVAAVLGLFADGSGRLPGRVDARACVAALGGACGLAAALPGAQSLALARA